VIPVLCHVILTPSMSSHPLCPPAPAYLTPSSNVFLHLEPPPFLMSHIHFLILSTYSIHYSFPLLNNQSSNYLYHLLFIISANPVYRYIGPPSSPSGTYPFLLEFPANHPVSILEASALKLQTHGCPKAPNRERAACF
jgi:hypothetical protein